MIAFGIEKLTYEVKFDKSYYYPFSFSDERRKTKVLFGACFGLLVCNDSIRVTCRPSETQLDKVDLFRYVYSDGFEEKKYIGSIDTERTYVIKLIFEHYNKVYRIQVFSQDSIEPVINICRTYKYPILPLGYTIKKEHGNQILLERK